MTERKQHWEKVYETKADQEVSWYQEVPTTSLDLIESLILDKTKSIIDIGGGNSNLTSELLKKGFTDLSVLDISAKSIERTQTKIGDKSKEIQWFVSDVLDFEPTKKYDLWHDRATFHFLTESESIEKYVDCVSSSIHIGGYFIVATFSTSGPEKCSGLHITQYSAEKLKQLFEANFEFVKSFEDTHQTPFDTEQNFVYVVFRRVGEE
jgi:ubiquinone/menaquinone biosynthesis C-methylase UbiE